MAPLESPSSSKVCTFQKFKDPSSKPPMITPSELHESLLNRECDGVQALVITSFVVLLSKLSSDISNWALVENDKSIAPERVPVAMRGEDMVVPGHQA